MTRRLLPIALFAALFTTTQQPAQSQQSAPLKLTLHLDQPSLPVSPRLYGLMTEEINFSYEGGLYGELIRNRSFKDSIRTAAFWELQQGTGHATMSLDRQGGLNTALPVSLHLDIDNAGDGINILNEGYWGIPVK